MSKNKILIVSTYAIKNAQHGGQRRVAAIVEAYQKVFDEVRFVAVFPPDYYQHYSRHDIALKGKARQRSVDSPYTGDITCGEAIYTDPHVKARFKRLLLSYKPDVIQVEQVFPYLGLKPLLEELGLSPKIILSSHNIEYIQKQEILESSGYADEAKEASAIIKACEADMAQNADLVVAVSEEDAQGLKKLGAKDVVVAPNGIAKLPLTDTATRHWENYKKQNVVRHIATFVGSAHPPNWLGFLDMVGDRIGFMPADSKLILAGSISDYFVAVFKDLQPQHATFWKRVMPAGRLSDELLTGLIDASEVLLLPITEGGGSNLKTAEAILSGQKIVATTYAFRSFEEYLKLPNIFIADTPEAFRQAILEAFTTPYQKRTEAQRKLADKVQWQYCLRPMVEGAKRL